MGDELVYRVAGIRHQAEIPPDAELDINHPAVQAAARRLNAVRAADRAARRREERDTTAEKRIPQPKRNRWRAISTGAYKRQLRPQSSPQDRLYVPAAIEHWRKVHGISRREAQARIGYSPTSRTWDHWVNGFVVPPYGTLVRMLAATGLGHWTDPEYRRGVDPRLRLQADRAQWAAGIREQRRRRAAAKAKAKHI